MGGSRSSSRWESHWPFYVLRIYLCLYWLCKLVVSYSPISRKYIRRVSVDLLQNIFRVISVLRVFLAANKKKGIERKLYKNETANIQIQDSVTVNNAISRKINTPFLLPIHWACRQSTAASVVFFNPLHASSILRRRLRSHCCSLRTHLPPLSPPLLSYIPQASCLAPVASVIVSVPSDTPYIPRPLLTPPLSLLSPRSWSRRRRRKYPDLISAPAPPPL